MSTVNPQISLPVGTEILERRGEARDDVELALELARSGASAELIGAVGGDAALAEIGKSPAVHHDGD